MGFRRPQDSKSKLVRDLRGRGKTPPSAAPDAPRLENGVRRSDIPDRLMETSVDLPDGNDMARLRAHHYFAAMGTGLGIWYFDAERGKGYFSDEYRNILGMGPPTPEEASADWSEETVFQFLSDRVHPDEFDDLKETFVRLFRDGIPYEHELRLRRDDGEYTWIRARGQVIRGEGKSIRWIGGVAEDISEQHQMLEDLRASQARAHGLANLSPFPLLITRPRDRKIVYFNAKADDVFGISARASDELDVADYFSDKDVYGKIRAEVLEKGSFQSTELELVRGDGQPFWAIVSGTIFDFEGEHCVYTALSDITERKRLEDVLQAQLVTDTLTGLSNRIGLRQALNDIIEGADGADHPFTLFTLDLDRFKVVNETLGHLAGDDLLVQAAQRLKEIVRAGDIVARLGGDEFAILAVGMKSDINIASLSNMLITVLSEPFALDGGVVSIGCSVGAVQYPLHKGNASDLQRWADIALYRAKNNGRGTHSLFDEELKISTLKRAELERELREALRRDEFFLEYQPRINCATGKRVAAEALLRWRHGTKGLIMPSDFISIAEECGLISQIGVKVLAKTCEQLHEWHQAGLELVPVSINLSPLEFSSKDVVDLVRRQIEFAHIDPSWLQIEITESALFDDKGDAANQIQALRDMGVKILIDDFGTGYSSLAHLSQLSVDKLKIDRSFIHGITEPNTAMLVRSVVSIGKSLGLTTVGEGVETQAQADFLAAVGCDELQGFLFDRPMSAVKFAAGLAVAESPIKVSELSPPRAG